MQSNTQRNETLLTVGLLTIGEFVEKVARFTAFVNNAVVAVGNHVHVSEVIPTRDYRAGEVRVHETLEKRSGILWFTKNDTGKVTVGLFLRHPKGKSG